MLKISCRIILAAMVVVTFSYNIAIAAVQATSESEVVDASLDLTPESLQKLLSDSEEKELSCEEFVSRIDSEIARVDEAMQAGVGDTAVLLEERNALVDLRLAQPCHSQVVTEMEPQVDELFYAECDCVEEIPCDIIEEEFVPDVGDGGFGGGFNSGFGGGFSPGFSVGVSSGFRGGGFNSGFGGFNSGFGGFNSGFGHSGFNRSFRPSYGSSFYRGGSSFSRGFSPYGKFRY